MQIYVEFVAFDTIVDLESIARTRDAFTAQVNKIFNSGKVRASGMFTDLRGGFFLLDVESSQEFFDLMSPSMYDSFHMKTHPVMPFGELVEFFQHNIPGAMHLH